MANNPFNRTIINTRERPASPDMNRIASDADRALRDVLMHLYTGRGAIYPDGPGTPPTGAIGEAFKVRPKSPASMTLTVKKGIFFIYSATTQVDINGVGGLNDLSLWKPAVLNADKDIVIPVAPGSPNNRIDLLEIRLNNVVGDPTSRDVLNISTGVFDPTLVNKTMAWDYDNWYGTVNNPSMSTAALSLKVGTAAPSPTAPSPTPGYAALALIYVDGGVTTLDYDKIVDKRAMLHPGGHLGVDMRVRFPSPGFASLVLEGLHAPPGVSAAAVWKTPGGSLIKFDLYLFCGADFFTAYPIYSTSMLTPGYGVPLDCVATPFITTIDAGMQSDLIGAGASPAIKVAVGQKVVKASYSLSIVSPGIDLEFGIHASLG